MDGIAPPHKKRRIGVMTSGGDAPGMNGAVRAVVRTAIHNGCTPFAIYEGYDGLVQGGDKIKEMVWEDVRGLLSDSGTAIGTARCMEFMQREGRLRAAKNMIELGIDALVVCGGDGSLTGADKFRSEWPGLLEDLVSSGQLTRQDIEPHAQLNVVGLVGSIDNDMSMTDATIGCYSSLSRICEAIDSIEATAMSHQRAFVIEVMGRHCGWLALIAGVSTGADYIFIPERPPLGSWEDHMCKIVGKHRKEGKRKTIVIVAEGAQDDQLQHISADMVKNVLSNRLKLDTRVTTLGHVQRGGNVCAYDRWLSSIQGVEAVHAVLDANPSTPSPLIAIDENHILRRPLVDAVRQTKDVTKTIEAKEFDKALDMRDAEFKEYWEAFLMTTAVEQPELKLSPEKQLRIGIIHVGAPAGGMNAATRAAVAYCLSRGHTPVALHNGFPGLQRHHSDKPLGSVRELKWLDADQWASRGGSEIGTNRDLPSANMRETAFALEKYRIQALLIIGGFEAFTALSELRKARSEYPTFKIPMVIMPATISNNVPGTEYSIGSDTCLNELIQYCDKLKQSASSSRRRVFVIETQGGATGYVATMAGLSVGAVAVYTPEEGISLGMISHDISHLKHQFSQDAGQSRSGKIILVNERVAQIMSAKVISDIVNNEAKGRFDCKFAVPGHVQQGGIPSPMDRVRAVRFGVKSLQHLESFVGVSPDAIAKDPMSATVIGIRGSRVKFTPMEQVEEHETDWKNRRPKNEFWHGWKRTVDMLSARHSRDDLKVRSLLEPQNSPPSSHLSGHVTPVPHPAAPTSNGLLTAPYSTPVSISQAVGSVTLQEKLERLELENARLKDELKRFTG